MNNNNNNINNIDNIDIIDNNTVFAGRNRIDNQYFISRQIAVYKTDKRLIEFLDKLNPAPIMLYAHIHAQADKLNEAQKLSEAQYNEGRKIYSNIGVVLQDYSAGTGENIIKVTANISPDEAQYIYSRVNSCVEKFEFASDKIFGQPDEKGYSKVTKFKVVRSNIGSDGKPRNYPWYVECENGRGIAEKNKTGGTYCKSQSFASENKVYINLNDLDFFKLMNRVASYIRIWESQYGTAVMIAAKTALSEQMAMANELK